MLAQTIRSSRLGDPLHAFKLEEIDVPSPAEGEVLIAVMAAGINFNNVWAARGVPIDVIAARRAQGSPHEFHVGGSDASGIVYAVGAGVANVKVGDEIVVHPGYWNPQDPHVKAGKDPMLAQSAQIWGYNTNFGSFGQFALAYEHQILPKAKHLSWELAAAPTLVGTTAYRMLHGWKGHEVESNDVVLVWGGSGGVGSQAIQIAKIAGAIPIAVVSDAGRGEYCKSLGAAGFIDRSEFTHWGQPPHWTDEVGQKQWTAQARAFAVNQGEVKGVRVGLLSSKPPVTRVVLDLKSPQAYQLFPLGKSVIVKLGGPVGIAETPQAATPEVADAQVPAPAPEKKVAVSYQDGMLSITSNKGSLADVLNEVHLQTGADIAIPAGAEQENVAVSLGPAPPRDVVAKLLDGSHYNFIIVGADGDISKIGRVILSLKGAGNVPSQAQPAESEPEPVPVAAMQPISPK